MEGLAYIIILAAIVGPPLLAFYIIKAAVREGVREALSIAPPTHPLYQPPASSGPATPRPPAPAYARLPGTPIPGRGR